ncbi:MAG: energy-coupling factor ABC transporter ATP-binding protein [Treponema sp.]|nr:energy-coupling factor ABC transporter ATP-binding protein [Treponema sp.]
MREILFSVRNLSKTFPGTGYNEGGFRALSGLNLNIFAGECLLVAGSNGSGKTVFMKILAALMDLSGGEVLFRGLPLEKAVPRLRRELGLVFQDADAQIIGETVVEDVAFGPKNLGASGSTLEERVNRALESMGLSAKRDFSSRDLSGGEKRRLAVAGILAMGCEIIILDEPFANLDYFGVIQVLELIRDQKKQGKTLIVLTHELEKVLAFADRLLILDRGILRDDGKPEEVLDRLLPEYGIRDPRQSYRSAGDCTWLPV